MKDWRYLCAYLLPLSAALALSRLGAWSWATVALAFGILPALELLLPGSAANVPPHEEDARSRVRLFDWLLYLNLPLVYALLGWYVHTLASAHLSAAEWLGLALSVGIVVGANGINVAHELGHRSTRYEQLLSKLLLLPALYQHFFVEHNRGHHKHVATDQDPASARLGEVVYAFWWRSVSGGWRSAWRIEQGRLQQAGMAHAWWHNEVLHFMLAQGLWLGGIGALTGVRGLAGAVAVAVVGFLLLETINYVEHYGLRRRLLPSGRPEPVGPQHSWNSDHDMGRIMLYELTRHSDHHYKATRKYQILRHMEQSPQLPYGYPASVVLALVPPLWFAVMDERARQAAKNVGHTPLTGV
ncbi:MAG TPA: alkane 1-monooxygenase [Saprospiraceae bacterium]|nr:alkane 1-monooxygenase [Saprospiraceae bacterium]HND88265.1 alkane 1-monooxygenase [Saprospiraceae bacterium]